jgi:hypothetical protein
LTDGVIERFRKNHKAPAARRTKHSAAIRIGKERGNVPAVFWMGRGAGFGLFRAGFIETYEIR